MSRQKKAVKQAAKGKAEAEEFIAKKVDDAVKRTRKSKPETLCTLEDIVRERDDRGLSWAQVAANLSLGSPGGARAAYTRLTGRHHSESNPTIKRSGAAKSISGSRRKMNQRVWDDDSDQDEIIEAVTHHDILIERVFRGMVLPEEWLHVCRISKFTFDGPQEELVMHCYVKEQCECKLKNPNDADVGRARAFRVRDIKAVM